MATATKLYAFLWRDWVEARSYKLAFLTELGGLALPLLLIFFLSRLFNEVEIESLSRYGGDYVAFALMGILVTTYSGTAQHAFSTTIRRAQVVGTLEVLFLTRASLPTLIFGWSLYPFIRSTLFMLTFLAGGFFVIGIRLDDVNLVGALLTLLLLVAVMGSIGIMAASFTLVFKQGDPFTTLLVLASGLLSGTLYPVDVLPGWLQVISKLLPQTHAIETLRMAVLLGSPFSELLPGLITLGLYAALLAPLSLLTFEYAIRRAKMGGSLAHY